MYKIFIYYTPKKKNELNNTHAEMEVNTKPILN